MSELTKHHPKRSDEEWISLINECRSSGMTDKAWCESRHIQTSKFYYHIRRLRAKACELPDNPKVQSQSVHHEIVKLELNEPHQDCHPAVRQQVSPAVSSSGELPDQPAVDSFFQAEATSVPAIHLSFGGVSIDIHNSADRSTILNTLSVLQALC